MWQWLEVSWTDGSVRPEGALWPALRHDYTQDAVFTRCVFILINKEYPSDISNIIYDTILIISYILCYIMTHILLFSLHRFNLNSDLSYLCYIVVLQPIYCGTILYCTISLTYTIFETTLFMGNTLKSSFYHHAIRLLNSLSKRTAVCTTNYDCCYFDISVQYFCKHVSLYSVSSIVAGCPLNSRSAIKVLSGIKWK